MKNFWPQRSKAEGFSIENLALKYREKISSLSSKTKLNQLLYESNSKSINQIATSHISIKKGHWANRDFSEYKEAS